MSEFAIVLIYLLIAVLYVLAYTFASFLFSYKIYLVSNKRFYLGAIVSGCGIFINFTLYAFVPYIAIATTHIWLSVVLLIALGVGAYFSNSVMSKVDFFHTKEKNENEEAEV